MIPKIIHQIWIGPNKQPDMWINTFRIDYINKNPEYQYILWTEENINPLFNDFPIYRIVYDLETTYCGKSDILRYLILFLYGGIYIDADSVWINEKSFDSLLEQVNESNVFAGKSPNNSEFNTKKDKKYENSICNGVMGSSKNNPLIRLLIDGIEKYIIRDWGNTRIAKQDYTRKRMINGVCEVTGPLYLNRILSNKNITIFPSIYFYPINWHFINDCKLHTKMDLPKESYTFQYGYTSNNLSDYII
jgi:mannosyltransferase OCH1-like enzyme